MDNEMIIQDALQTLDFATIHAHMVETNWTYFFDRAVPTIERLRETAAGLVRAVLEQMTPGEIPRDFTIQTGGFIAQPGGDVDVVRIRFTFNRGGDEVLPAPRTFTAQT
jgi:hypothetical protein